jgi:putative RNA 2'-phosphotransferase
MSGSKKLSWLLRHGATEAGLPMDPAGWVDIAALLSMLQMDRAALDQIVADNTKSRLQVAGDRIRACQGHSFGVPVQVEALEASWDRYEGPDRVWHGTSVEAAEKIAASGEIARGERSHVHLAPGLESVVGKRAGVHVMLGVSVARVRAEGLEVFESPNGVVLCRVVPSRCIDHVEPQTKRAKKSNLADLFLR